MFSGLQPTGKLHLGNYVGALKFWLERQADYESIFCIADLHGLTNPEAIRPIAAATLARVKGIDGAAIRRAEITPNTSPALRL